MADEQEDYVLQIHGMSKSFGRNRVLDHINLNVRRGTVMGLMGCLLYTSDAADE